MNAAYALQSFRPRTALLSFRTLAPAPASSRPRPSRSTLPGRRHYSEEKPAPDVEDAAKDNTKAGETPLSPDQEKLKAKEVEVVDLTGRLRYLQADFLNLQRNAAREKEQTRDFAITRFASDLLETVDVLALALKSVPPSALEQPSSEQQPSTPPDTPKTSQQYLQELYTGVEMTQRLLSQTLFKYHVKPYDPTGDKFDPNLHEALYQAPIPGKEPGTVIDCQKIGYMIKDRVLRAAQVGVAQETS